MTILAKIVLICVLSLIFQAKAYSSGNEREKSADDGTAKNLSGAYGRLPLQFIKNTGQADEQVLFYAHGPRHAAYFIRDGVYLLVSPPDSTTNSVEKIKLNLIGSNTEAAITGEGRLKGEVNYLKGPSGNWRRRIPTYASVLYKDVYDGVDLRFYGRDTALEYDVIIKPGAKPSEVVFSYEGVKNLNVASDGGLEIGLSGASLYQKKPYIYQEVEGKKVKVEGSFKVIENRNGRFYYGFDVASYDKKLPLVIDPEIIFSFYAGGSASDISTKTAVDPSGNLYIAGTTASLDYPVASALSSACKGCGPNHDIFITKIDPTGTSVIYSTYLGGSLRADGVQSDDLLGEITVDSAGSAYVTGSTTSVDFPLTPTAVSSCLNTTCNHQYPDAFISKISPDGATLLYSSYLGGSWWDEGDAVAVDQTGNIYVTGNTWSRDLPLKNQIFNAPADLVNGFVAKIDPTVAGPAGLVYSTYIGGDSRDNPRAIAVDGSGSAYITGETSSSNFPVTSAPINVNGGGKDIFVTKLNPSGTALEYSTYLSGNNDDFGYAIAVDPSGSAYVAGSSASTDLPVSASLYGYHAGGSWGYDSFVAKLNPSGTALAFSTYLGGTQDDEAYSIALDRWGNAYVAGYTSSADFTVVSPLYGAYAGGGRDAFLTVVNSRGSALLFSSYLGGSLSESASGVAVDLLGSAYVAGVTASANFPNVNPIASMCRGCSGTTNAFVAKINVNPPPSLSYPSEAGFADGLGPDSGTALTDFVYKIIYESWNNTAPSYVNTCVDDACSQMSVDTLSAPGLHDGDYSNGEQYVYAASLPAGQHTYDFQASDGTAVIRTTAWSGPLVSDLFISTTALPDAEAGVAYNASFSASGGTAPYSWSVPGGLPPGLSLGSTGAISGTPTAIGTYSFSVTVTDSSSTAYTKAMTIDVAALQTIDLVVDSITAPSEAVQGGLVNVAYTVANRGNKTSAASVLRLYLSADNVVTASDRFIGSRSVAALAGGASGAAATSVKIPGGVSVGTYYIGAIADADNTNIETDEGNNSASSPAIVVKSGVDLSVSSLIPPSTAVPGTFIDIQNTVFNKGPGTSALSTVRLYLSTDTTITSSDILLAQRSVGNLVGGASVTATTSVKIPGGMSVGTYYIGALSDAANTNPEYDETNNIAYSVVTLTSGVDLSVSSVTAPATAVAGTFIDIRNTVFNKGPGTSASSTLRFYISTDNVITTSDLLIGGRSVGNLAAGTSSTATTSIKIPGGVRAGTYYIGAVADATDTNPEYDESNNAATAAATVISLP